MNNLAAWITTLSAAMLIIGLLVRIVWIGGRLVQQFGDHMASSDKVHRDQEARIRALEARPPQTWEGHLMPFSMAPDNGRVNHTSKLIVNPWTGPVTCCWDDCYQLARDIWPVRLHEHPPHVPCSTVDAAGGAWGRHAFMTFCSARCRDYWLWCSGWRAKETAARNNGKIYGMAPAGSKLGRFR